MVITLKWGLNLLDKEETNSTGETVMTLIGDAVTAMVEAKQNLIASGATEAEVNTAMAGVVKGAASLFTFPVTGTLFGPFELNVDESKMEAFLEEIGLVIVPIIPGTVVPEV